VKITLELKNVEGFENESATLTCDLSKTGRADGQWLFNGQPLTTSERVQLKVDGHHQIVEFAELTISDAGQYTYSIENVSTSATLTVRGTTCQPTLQSAIYFGRRMLSPPGPPFLSFLSFFLSCPPFSALFPFAA